MPGRSGRLAVSWGLHWGSSRGVAAGRYDGGRRRGRRGGSGYRRGRRRGSRGQRSLRRGASWRLRGARGGRLRSDRAQRRVRSTDRFTGLWGLCRALRGFRHPWSRLVLGGLRQGDQRRIHPGPAQHAAHQQQDIAARWHSEHCPESADRAMAMPGRIHENRLPGGEGRHKRGILPVLEAPCTPHGNRSPMESSPRYSASFARYRFRSHPFARDREIRRNVTALQVLT
ncbi:MAG: hypothetical protein QOH84_3416 [Kribbellaceae bacterium]|nr:hypothetical protein [Kribbellaceae bacterium]